jgi:hypothetical protein
VVRCLVVVLWLFVVRLFVFVFCFFFGLQRFSPLLFWREEFSFLVRNFLLSELFLARFPFSSSLRCVVLRAMSYEAQALINFYANERFFRHVQAICNDSLKKRGDDPILIFWKAFGIVHEGLFCCLFFSSFQFN